MLPEYDDSHTLRNSRRTSSLFAAAQEALPPPVHFESHRISDDQLKACTNKRVKKFYEVNMPALSYEEIEGRTNVKF